VYITSGRLADAVDGLDLAEICITSGIRIETGPAPDGAFRLDEVPEVAVASGPAAGEKCDRCWRVRQDVGKSAEHPTLCDRCVDAIG